MKKNVWQIPKSMNILIQAIWTLSNTVDFFFFFSSLYLQPMGKIVHWDICSNSKYIGPIYYLQFKTLLLSTHFYDVDYKIKHRVLVKSNRRKREASVMLIVVEPSILTVSFLETKAKWSLCLDI